MSPVITDKKSASHRTDEKPDDSLSSASFRRIRGIENLASEFREGDGVPTTDERSRRNLERRREKPNYAEARLGREVFDTLSQSIALPSDPRLSAFAVANVTPTGKGSNYLVQVFCIDSDMKYRPEEIQAVLEDNKGALRAEIAAHINRKKVPDLKFDVLPPSVRP